MAILFCLVFAKQKCYNNFKERVGVRWLRKTSPNQSARIKSTALMKMEFARAAGFPGRNLMKIGVLKQATWADKHLLDFIPLAIPIMIVIGVLGVYAYRALSVLLD